MGLHPRLLSYDGAAFGYDENGNTTSKTETGVTTGYHYDVTDRMVRVSDAADATIAEYAYDPFGRRLWKDVDGTRTYFFYTDVGLTGEYDATGNEIKSYGYRPHSEWTTAPVYMKENGEYYYHLNDHLGTPQKIVNSQAVVVWSATYKSFGEVSISPTEPIISNNLRFPGQYYDTEAKLHYNWNRYFDSILGRYLTSDTIEDGTNFFIYVKNNSIILIDSRGLCASYVSASTTWILDKKGEQTSIGGKYVQPIESDTTMGLFRLTY